MSAPTVTMKTDDAIELGELLDYVAGWIDTHHDELDRSHRLFAHGPYPARELRDDLLRFASMLGVDYGGPR
jgi:hypothetical protein